MIHKRQKKNPRNVCALTWTTHIILADFILPGFINCIHIKTLAPSVKGRGNMQIILKDFLVLTFYLSLKDSDDYNTSSKCDSNECSINDHL